MRDVNYDRLRDLAGYLRDALRQLRELETTPRDVFLADARTVNSTKYLLIVAAEAALDICNHLAARRGGRSPADYADCIAVLREIGAYLVKTQNSVRIRIDALLVELRTADIRRRISREDADVNPSLSRMRGIRERRHTCLVVMSFAKD